MNLYLILLLSSIAIPLALSFDKKLQFFKKWNYVLPGIIIIGIVYISFDIWLTKLGVWGFNPKYHSKYIFMGLPLEEWLFFFIIPYASLFIHYSFTLYFPKIQFNSITVRVITMVLIVCMLLLVLFYTHKIYTLYIASFTALALIISLFQKEIILKKYYVTFLVVLIPFVAVNAILTGSLIEAPIVWYNNSENLGIRFLTIPIEDFMYAFSLLLLNLQAIEFIKCKIIQDE